MEASVLSPTSWEKRRAWLRQSRNWQTQVLEEEAAAVLQDVPESEPSSLDDVFQEGNPIHKIEDWLQDCGDSEEGFCEEAGQSIYNECSSHGASFEDDLTLGAEATLLAANGKLFSRSFLQTPRPGQLLDLGCSLASSSMTGGTNKTSSSISEILDQVQEDAEDVLFSLGFGQEDHRDTSRIPARFFTNPSQAKGIDFQLFLKAQVRRIEMEDPCLMLASRFKQVQTLAVTADAFFCLYSYVSKTPVQKFTPSHMFWNCNPTDVPSIRILTPESEPHSPKERLRKAISKMCLYTGSRDRFSSPHNTPKRNSLDQVVWEVMDRVREEKLVLQKGPGFGEGPQKETAHPTRDSQLPATSPCVFYAKEETQQGMSTVRAPPQDLDSNPEAPCCIHSLTRAYPQWSTNSAQVRRELWGLQATNKEAHSATKEIFWERKSKARKNLFQKSSLDKKFKSLDLSVIQQKWKQSQNRPELHHSITQQPQHTVDSEKLQLQSNSEEEESCWSSRPTLPDLSQTFPGKNARSFLHPDSSTCSDSSGFSDQPNSYLF
ncbi:protein TESPA1 isoform X3 [Sciurus carolinensis]|uniref:protein TESPA1 isoform X3 n=1 Tax=Sciurus carolinensis TaxID=30640 RepID=UPI001FB55845|nr:protein TESPA1 isoform X3 [Sciurus carolinensis]